MKLVISFAITMTTVLSTLGIPVIPIRAQTLSYRLLERDKAIATSTKITVSPGRAIPISFSKTDETISYILLADSSKITYTTDAELKSFQAKTIFLRMIEPVKFSGATTTSITNLLVQTFDSKGEQRLYNFDIVPQNQTSQEIGIQITIADGVEQTLTIEGNRTVTINDIETGLKIALRRGYTPIDDPVVYKVHQLLNLVKSQRMTISEAAKSVGVPLAVISELGTIALDNRLLRTSEKSNKPVKTDSLLRI